MISSESPLERVANPDEFEIGLYRLLESATSSDIDIRGAYHFAPAGGEQEDGIEISRVRWAVD